MIRLRPRLTDESGSTLPLIIFFGFLCLVLVLLVVSATSLYLERKRLFTLADGAALVGAEAFTLEAVELTESGMRPRLTDAEVAAAVQSYVESTPAAGFEALTIERSETVDGRSATVTLSSWWHPPLLSPLVPEGLRIEVTSVGRSVFD
ncbi:hypothetical protein GCM10007382_05870 [Salinibacterium xinjiangense]|uniref:Flp pilus-assembly TadE/G-like n=1 Tax=Salinibacterium xinjiangense TaxID=386302 RepID=A0A2C8ZJB1_9MICO|nr:pilus assembly protein TadG-related protein [Salinibacterium xinjiangense]GGK88797.1 hypothetical protein GCM10007382_05870 [Salinibacterium xinjiangense]SOE64825.1 Putative Flp pilus-assembly TadE/G-like [Salinibacterium xinjiangense]